MTQDEKDFIFDHLSYSRETGLIVRKKVHVKARRLKVGEVANSRDSRGYKRIVLAGKSYKQHRLAWLFAYGEWPADDIEIDHINGVKCDNRIENLRKATRSQNAKNRGKNTKGASKYKGVSRHKRHRIKPWVAQIRFNKQTIYLGAYNCETAAYFAYRAAEIKLFGEFARRI